MASAKTRIRDGGTTDMAEQNFANHVRWVPGYHFFVIPALSLNFGWSIYRWKLAGYSLDAFISVLTAAALVLLMVYARTFALAVQNRVIRLEYSMSLHQLLPEDIG